MIKHLVFWRLKDRAHGQDKATNARLIKEKLEALQGVIPGLLRIEVGIDWGVGSSADGGDASGRDESSDVVLYSEFTDREALACYQAHSAHQALLPFIGEARNERRVVDYVIESETDPVMNHEV